MIADAERRLREAVERRRALVAALAEAGRGVGWAEVRAAEDEELAAERDLARASGHEYAVDLDIGLTWDIGAPLPHLLASGHGTFVLFHLADVDSGWDGTSTTVVDPGAPNPVPLGVVEFHRTHAVTLGGPNDEAVDGHPLSGRGLRPYAAHEVVGSSWIAAAERINSVHPLHQGGWHRRLHHYVFCFHDEILECLAEGFTAEARHASPREVLSELAGRMLE